MNPSKTNTSSSKNSTGSSSDQRTTSTRPNSESEYSSRSSSHLDVHDDMVELGGPGFVQIIHKYLVQHGEICIPKGFVREYGGDFSDHAVLTVPSGIEWFVEVERDDGEVYFRNGLKEFFENYSITSGHFLTFKFEGNSHFNVLIFQMSGEEIDYSSFNNHPEETSSRSTDSIEEQESASIGVDVEDDYYSSDEDDEDNGDSEGDGESEEIRADITRKGKISITPGGLETQERAIAVQRDFKSSNNYPFFTIGIQPSYVDHKYLPIPSYFEGKEELKELENIKLKVVPNYGRSWIVHLPTWGQAHGTRFSKGVSKFLKDNEVKVGDVCVFEMVTKKSARVHILRS